MVPAVVDQVTAVEYLPVPTMIALQFVPAPGAMTRSTNVQLTVTDLMPDDGGTVTAVSRIVATANFVLSCVLVTWTVTLEPVAGAVKLPEASMLPAEAVHVTA